MNKGSYKTRVKELIEKSKEKRLIKPYSEYV